MYIKLKPKYNHVGCYIKTTEENSDWDILELKKIFTDPKNAHEVEISLVDENEAESNNKTFGWKIFNDLHDFIESREKSGIKPIK